jgi:probable O-glycosylation ligase (exosortase A-associated)
LRSISRGWRSRPDPDAGVLTAPPANAAPRARARLTPNAAALPAKEPYVWPWKDVKWNLAFIGFCIYSVVVITYIAPLGQIAMVVALIGLLFGRDRVRFPAPLIFFALYYFYALAMYPTAMWPTFAEKELKMFLRVGLIFLVAINVLTERSRLRFYIFLYLAAFALYPVRGAIFNQFVYNAALQGRIAWNNMFANPNDLAALLLGPLGLACGVLYTERHKYMRWAAMAGVPLIALIIFMTQSRGAILALACFGTWVFLRQKRRLRMLPGLLVVGLVVAIFAPNSVWTRIRNLRNATSSGDLVEADDKGSAEQRFEIWKVAWKIARDDPISGVGLGVYPYAHWRYARSNAENFKPTARGVRDAHSSYFTALAETGVPGLIFWLGIFVSTYFYAQRARRLMRTFDPDRERQLFFMQASLLGLGVAGLFGSYNGIVFPYLNIAILYCTSYVALETYQGRQTARAYAARGG